MRSCARQRFAWIVPVLAAALAQPLIAVTPAWFDINPSQSNGNGGRNGTSSGRVNHVGAASDLSRVYAATEWGGLYTSFDQGNNWVRINTFSPSATWDVKVDPGNNQRVYATSFFDGRATQQQSGISISNDAGNTWTPVNIPVLDNLNCKLNRAQSEPSGWQIAINPNNPNFVFVGTNCGLARSLDRGNTWSFVDPSPGDQRAEQVFAVLAQDSQTVDVISSNGHFRSLDNGNTWTPVPTAPGPVSPSGVTAGLAASPRESYVLFAENSTNIWESDDGGNSWPTSLALPLRGNATNVQGRISFIKTNQLSTSDQFDVWYGDVNLFKTTATTPSTLAPGGTARAPLNSWANMQGSAHDDNGDIMFDPKARAGSCPKLFTSDGGVFTNSQVNNPDCQGPGWQQPNTTPHATWLWGFDGIQLSPGTHGITYGLQDDGGFAATNVAEGFNPPPPNWNNYVCCDLISNVEQSGNVLDVEGSAPGPRAFQLFIHNQDGSGGNEVSKYPSGALFSPGIFSPGTSGKQIAGFGQNAFAINLQFCPSGKTPCGEGVYFTNDITNPSWTSLGAPFSATSSGGNIKIAKLGGQPNVFYNTSNGNPETPGVLFVSTLIGGRGTAGGANWTPINLPPGILSVNTYDTDSNDGRRIIVSGIDANNNFEIWKTGDLGANWLRLPQLENLMLRSTPSGGGIFLNHTTVGPLTFESFGTYWQPSMFQFNPLNSTTIVAGAMDAGIFVSLDDGNSWQIISDPTNPTSASPPIPRPLFAHFSPGRFNASTASFDVWIGARGAGVRKVVIDQP
jgi:hypothetical protein